MSFLLLRADGITKSFAGKLILDIKAFRVYAGDRIGFVGANGCGKTTFLDILAGEALPDEGSVKRICDIAYARQFGKKNAGATDLTENAAVGPDQRASHKNISDFADEPDKNKKLSEYGVKNLTGGDALSGGEKNRIKLAHALSVGRRLLFADEPTTNLDAEGAGRFVSDLMKIESFIVVSHDRELLNKCCSKIITIENRELKEFEGGYDEYKSQTEERRRRERFEYERYEEERERLLKVYAEKKSKAAKVVKKPKGISSSEIKQRNFINTSRSFDGRERGFERAAKAVQARIEQMEKKERPAAIQEMKLDFSLTDPPKNKIVISGDGFDFKYGERIIFEDASFEVKNGSRVSLQGQNGVGKTTLLDMIYSGDERIYRVPKARFGYFKQEQGDVDYGKSVLQNALANCVQSETTARTVLARLLFKRDEINKPAGVLSGGERVKLSLAMLLVSQSNVLLLDEPTNYMDIPSLEALQAMLGAYEGTLVFVSHDSAFAGAVATARMTIGGGKIKTEAINY